jgi:hypothetical protein
LVKPKDVDKNAIWDYKNIVGTWLWAMDYNLANC